MQGYSQILNMKIINIYFYKKILFGLFAAKSPDSCVLVGFDNPPYLIYGDF